VIGTLLLTRNSPIHSNEIEQEYEMHNRFLWLTFAAVLLGSLTFLDSGDAQPPGKKGKKGDPFARPVSADQIVDRILSFDKNNDGKITLEELPERMQHLIALGDVNKDGALDKEEIRKLATTLESFAGLTGNGPPLPPPGAPPKGPGPKGGPKGGPGKGPGAEIQRTLDELSINGPARDSANRLLRAHQDKVRRFEELSRSELILQLKDVLNEEDYRVLKSALDRPIGPASGFKGPRQENVNGRIEQLQRELDDLRKKLAK
jgi:hypothetical protein